MAQERGTTCARCGGARDGKARYCSACNRDYKWCWRRWGRDHRDRPRAESGVLVPCTTCPTPHYLNCPTCYGYGVRPSGKAKGETVPVAWSDMRCLDDGTAAPCPTCGSTLAGMP